MKKKELKRKRMFFRDAIIRLTERHTPSAGSEVPKLTQALVKQIGDEAELLYQEWYRRSQLDKLSDSVPVAKRPNKTAS